MRNFYTFLTRNSIKYSPLKVLERETAALGFCFLLFFTLFTFTGYGQTAAFPYSISVNSVPGKCYDDCRIIIHIYDDNGNEILVNPQTHNAQDVSTYPLYNIQYHYRNTSAGTNIHYDTVNDIQVTNGIYCVGVIAHVPVTLPGGGIDYVLVDTSVCNVEVATSYDHMEASILSGQARNDYEWSWDENYPREFCGWRPSYSCADRGRIQLKIIKGKFPYRVLILNTAQDTVRNVTFYQRQQSGEDSLFADFRDYYTFDQIPVGNYSIRVSDSCDYSLWLTINIPDAHPTHIGRASQNNINCPDSNVVYFQFTKDCNVPLHDYDKAYFDSILQYRFINPGGYVTSWYAQDFNIWDPNWSYVSDTIPQISNYCQLYGDTILFQVQDLCLDTIYTSAFYFDRNFYIYEDTLPTSFDMITTPDTCIIHANSGMTTQTYNYYGDPWWCGGCQDWNEDTNWPTGIGARLYTCPISYDVWSGVDSSLISHNESDDFSWLSAPVTFTVDTTIPVHITVTDAKGCLLASRDEVFTFDVENAGDIPYPYETRDISYDWGWMGCCWDRYVYIRQEINASLYRKNMTVQLVESPLYNRFNFTATCQNGEWSFTTQDPNNQHTYAEFSIDENSWQVTVRDSICLAPGRYTFVITSSCGIDTVTHITSDIWYYDSLSLDTLPTFNTTQVCDRLIVQVTPGVMNRHYFTIDQSVDNNEANEEIWETWSEVRVADGVAGGYSEWPDENGNFALTIPGQYVFETRSWESCTSLYHYDTIEFVPVYVDFNQGFAILCDNLSNTGFISTHAYNGSEPYTYYLYDQPDLSGNIIGTSDVGRFPLVPMVAGQQFSVMVEDSCHNSFYINLTATPISQSALAWEFGNFSGNGHCEGDSIHLAALPFAFDVAYQWYGPNGFSSTDRENHIYLPYGSESGYYTLEVFNTGCATQVMDSVYIEVIQAPTVTILSDTTVCSGDGVTLGFQVQGNGPVTFDIAHTGAPATGSSTFTANAGSTIYQYYPIESNNLFWPENISDTRCAYDYLIDTVQVSLYNPAISAPVSPNTVDGYACYNHTASLRAFSNISTPYYVYWYQDNRQQSLLQCDTIYNSNNYSTLYVNNVTGDTSVYVSIANAGQCAATYGALNHVVNMYNGSTLLLPGEGARLYDSGGELGDYGDNEQLIHTFNCPGETRLDLMFNSVDIAIGDTLYVYSGATPTPSTLLASLTHTSSINSLIVNQSAVTFKFNSNWANNRSGWSIDVFTSVPMTPVSAHVSPLNYDTVAAVLCTSETPYPSLYFPDLDISQPTVYLKDTLFVSDDGCQTAVHLHVIVNPVSHTELHDTLMPCQLPFSWNGVTFSDFGTQTATMTNTFGCDSIITMTVHWGPPADSTTVYDTIVENQLPYHINGLTFNEPGVQVATLQTQDGCDSIVTVHLFVHHNVTAEADSVICDNALPLVWNGVTFTHNDTQTVVLTAHTGADSILTMNFFVNPTSLTTFTDTTCQYAAYNGFGFSLSESETTTPGFITLYRTDSNIFNCDSVIELHLLITPVITPNFFAEPDKAILSENPDIHFTNITNIEDLSGMNYFWIWDYGDGATDSTDALQTEHLYSQWGDFTVTLTLTIHDCVSEYSIPVTIEADLVFPNVITPNGDGINDVFVIKDMNPDRANRLVIVDRWGKTVFSQENYQTYMKDEQIYNAESGFGMGDIADGVYYYTFYYEGAVRTIRFNGSITVIK
jgi:gliding motility-associated-like protein